MNDKKLEKINFITGVFGGCLWSLEDEELDELYKQTETFHTEMKEKSREFAHKLIDKFLGGSYR